MKFKNVFWGLILILFGSLLIARNLDLLYFDWFHFAKLWPVLFILWGISVLPVRDMVKIVLLVVVLGGSTLFVVNSSPNERDDEFGFVFDNWNNNHFNFKSNQLFSIPWADTIQNASLDLDAAAGSFRIVDTTSQLLHFDQSGARGTYKYFVKRTPDNTKVEITERDHHVFYRKQHKRVEIKLNPEPVWDINLDAGASEVKYDLSAFKIRKITIDGGAGSFKVTLGDRYQDTYLDIDAGASSIVIKIPEASGCDLELSSVLSGKNLEGFENMGDGHYQTSNYDSAQNKVHMNIDAAVSSFTILRY